MANILRDLRFLFRIVGRRPSYPVLATSILAVGLSASVALFTNRTAITSPFPGWILID